MKRRSKLFLASALTVTSIAAACTFPDVGFRTDTSENDSGMTDVQDGSADAEVTIFDSGEIVEAAAPSEGGLTTVEECSRRDSGSPCDCDDDGYERIGCDAGPDSGLKPGDCDDYNRDRRPDAPFMTVPLPEGGWDWNCDGKVEMANAGAVDAGPYVCPPDGNHGCSDNSAQTRFSPEVPCGVRGDVRQCNVTKTSVVLPGLLPTYKCSDDYRDTMTRGCK